MDQGRNRYGHRLSDEAKAVIQDDAKSGGNSTVGELCKFWADTPDSIPTDLISNEKLDANLCLDIAGIISSILATPITAQPAR
jgi:hypothetical protein